MLIYAGTAGSLTRTLIVPRGLGSRLSSAVSRLTRSIFLFVAGRFENYRAKDKILALQGPLTMLGLLAAWLLLFLFAFGLMLWPIAGAFSDSMRQAGAALFTLGVPSNAAGGATAIGFLAAATGLVVVALQIAYLPTLYAAFNRRETMVTTLQSRAGVPAWGPEILARHQLVSLMGSLPALYAEWERWAADLAESHANYPVLISFRSPHPLRSWVLALLSVMDSAALYLALAPSAAPVEARLSIRMGFTALRDIAAAIEMPFDPDPMPDAGIRLSYAEFMTGVARLRDAGFQMERAPEEAWLHFQGWRVNYETISYELADRVVAPPGPWSGPRTHVPGAVIEPMRPVDRRPDNVKPEHSQRTRSDWSL